MPRECKGISLLWEDYSCTPCLPACRRGASVTVDQIWDFDYYTELDILHYWTEKALVHFMNFCYLRMIKKVRREPELASKDKGRNSCIDSILRYNGKKKKKVAFQFYSMVLLIQNIDYINKFFKKKIILMYWLAKGNLVSGLARSRRVKEWCQWFLSWLFASYLMVAFPGILSPPEVQSVQ